MTSVDIDKVVFFDGPATAGVWGRVPRALAPCPADEAPLKRRKAASGRPGEKRRAKQ